MVAAMTLRNGLIAMSALATVLIASAHTADAREPRPYCFQGGRGTTGGLLQCSFYTFEQCLRTNAGGEGICSVNPELGWRARERAQAYPPKRSRDGVSRW